MILPDWGGRIIRSFGLRDTGRVAAVAMIDGDGWVSGVHQGEGLAELVLYSVWSGRTSASVCASGYRGMAELRASARRNRMVEQGRGDRFRELEEAYSGYVLYDRDGHRVGKVDELFVDESGREEYLGVKLGLLGTRTTLIPREIVEVDEEEDCAEAVVDRELVKRGPAFGHGEEITPELEASVRAHYGLEALPGGLYEDRAATPPAEDGDEERVRIRRRARGGNEEPRTL